MALCRFVLAIAQYQTLRTAMPKIQSNYQRGHFQSRMAPPARCKRKKLDANKGGSMRKTKIVCTLGPASTSYDQIKKMALAGMNVARINMSHGTYEEHQVRVDNVKKVRRNLGVPIPIMIDTKGPEIRIGTFKNGKIEVVEGMKMDFVADNEAITPSLSRTYVPLR